MQNNTYLFHLFCSSRTDEEDEYEDGTTDQNWVLAPKTQDTDVTLILNKLLREYDKKLRPDIGSKYFFLTSEDELLWMQRGHVTIFWTCAQISREA